MLDAANMERVVPVESLRNLTGACCRKDLLSARDELQELSFFLVPCHVFADIYIYIYVHFISSICWLWAVNARHSVKA